jgi:superfamily II DNA helicase RecQ
VAAEAGEGGRRPSLVVYHDRTLAEIADRSPKTLDEVARIAGVGPTKLDRYGRDVLAALRLP